MTVKCTTTEPLDLRAAVGPQLVRALRGRIICNDLEPGARLSESEIAGAYSISRQPVREAFIKLAEEGLLEVRPQRGTFVRKIDVTGVMDARFVREAIEADIVKQLAADRPADLDDALRDQLARQTEAAADRDPLRFIQLDETFHRTLAEAAGRSYAWQVVESVKAQMDRVRHLSAKRFPIGKLVTQHAKIARAIMAGDAESAEAAMRRHLREILTDLPAVARAKPEFFEDNP